MKPETPDVNVLLVDDLQENLVALTGKNTLVDTEPDKDTVGYVVTALDDFRAKGPVGEPATLDG